MFLCPQCRKILVLEPRYQKYIKEKFRDIQNLKNWYIERNYKKNEISFLAKSQKIFDRILEQFGEFKERISFIYQKYKK